MQIREIYIDHFGALKHRRLELLPHLNIVTGKNEAGKSTLHSFIMAMLFGLSAVEEEKGQPGKFLPWEEDGSYGGSLVFEQQGKVYVLERCFLPGKETVTLTDVEADRVLPEPEKELKALLCGMTLSGCLDTVSIGQLQTKSAGLLEELTDRMHNLESTGSVKLDLREALERLAENKTAWEKRQVPDAKERLLSLSEQQRVSEEQRAVMVVSELSLREKLDKAKTERLGKLAKKQQLLEDTQKRLGVAKADTTRLETEIETWKQDAEEIMHELKITSRKVEQSGRRLPFRYKANLVVAGLIFFVALVFSVIYGLQYANPNIFYPYRLRHAGYIFAAMLALLTVSAIDVVVSLRRTRRAKARYHKLLDRRNRIGEAERSLNDLKRHVEGIRQDQVRQQTEVDNLTNAQEEQELDKKLHDLIWDEEQQLIKSQGVEREIEVLQEALVVNEEARKEIEAIDLAARNLEEAAQAIRMSFGSAVHNATTEYLSRLTGGAYTALTMTYGGEITVVSAGGRETPLASVSQGTLEQVYLALRLAAADMLYPESRLPLMLDDTFAYFDDRRTRQAMELLAGLPRQIIILSCHDREARIWQQMKESDPALS